jgi:hypothetical protein
VIQRIQSVYLLLAALLLLGSLLSANAILTAGEATYNFSPFGLLSEQNTAVSIRFPYLLLLATLGIPLLGLLASVFLFGNRKKQIQTVRWCTLALLIHLVAESFLYFHAINSLKELLHTGEIHTRWGMGSFFPLPAVAACMLAVAAIRRDEELVKSADRIR